MGVQTAAGSKFYMGSQSSAAKATLEEFEQDDYTEVNETEEIPPFGSSFSETTFIALGDRLVRKFKGSENPGTIEVPLGFDPADAGQNKLRAALESDAEFNFKITLNDAGPDSPSYPTTFYFRARVMGAPVNIGNTENVVRNSIALSINTRPYMIPAA